MVHLSQPTGNITMHIALYHDAIIPPGKYGGTERIVFWLAQALLELGHQVTLVAHPGSHVEGADLIEIGPDHHQETDGISQWERKLPSSVDLIHLQATPHRPPQKPSLVTIHGNGQPGETFLPNTVFLSRKHAENHGATVYVHNGINPDEYPCDPVRDDFLVFLAKASWKVKNLAGAIELARAARLPLYVMGSREWPLRLQRKLPAFGGIHYLGMVDDEEKKKYLRKARALLFPVRWHEPFGIAMTEALASGCPVLGTPYGSLPELIPSDAGYLSENADDLLRAIREKNFHPQTCRARVFQGLTHLDMARSYVELYKAVLNGQSLVATEKAPRSLFAQSPQTLLPYNYLK
jgi:glycosyltransferase involved in cell wall biosynthesis